MEKPFAVFLSEQAENQYIRSVFTPAVTARISAYVDLAPGIFSRADLGSEELRRAEYAFSTWGMAKLSEEEIRTYLPNLKAVFYGAGSVQDFARPFLAAGAAVHSAWAANAVPVVEYAVAQIVLANKGFFQTVSRGSAADYPMQRDAIWDFTGNYNTRVGIIGCGMIGSMVCERLRGYRLEVLVSDPFASDEKLAGLGARRASLEEIFSRCKTISNHTANLPETVGMLRYEHFSRMMPTSVFVNTGRGAQVVEADLIRALREDPTRAAVLDVTLPEPPEKESPLWTLPNVFLTPHIAGSMGGEIERMGEYMADELERRMTGRPCLYSVSLKMLETMA